MQLSCIIRLEEILVKKGSIVLFQGHGPQEETRLFFPTWEVDGRLLKGVSLRPHRCDPAICEYGDHMHVDVYDDPLEIIAQDAVTLTDEQEKIVTEYLRAQLAADSLIYEIEALITSPNAD